jgi:arabinose-5-phosphate isomerase
MNTLVVLKEEKRNDQADLDQTGISHRAVVVRARDIVLNQAEAVRQLASRIDEQFARAVRLLLHTPGHVVISGIGKSGLVGRKIAATFASTGTPSFFVHTTEALHGDLGKITNEDTVILMSYSGETGEVLELLSHLVQRGIPTIAIVGELDSSLARSVDVVLDASVEREVCPNNLAPTSSTLAALSLGDTLAVCLMEEREFDAEDFARLHPGGQLGRRLRMRVEQAMRSDALPTVSPGTYMPECLGVASRGRMGIAVVIDETGRPVGILGHDVMRFPVSAETSHTWFGATAASRMNSRFLCVSPEAKLGEIHAQLKADEHGLALVVDSKGVLVGLVER